MRITVSACAVCRMYWKCSWQSNVPLFSNVQKYGMWIEFILFAYLFVCRYWKANNKWPPNNINHNMIRIRWHPIHASLAIKCVLRRFHFSISIHHLGGTATTECLGFLVLFCIRCEHATSILRNEQIYSFQSNAFFRASLAWRHFGELAMVEYSCCCRCSEWTRTRERK